MCRSKRLQRKHEQLADVLNKKSKAAVPDLEAALDNDVGADLLRLVFTACHPVLATEASVALTLPLLEGLTTEEIAPAFPVPEPSIAKGIVRVKRILANEQIVSEGVESHRGSYRLRFLKRFAVLPSGPTTSASGITSTRSARA
jgi:predicted RNA polymerase sigma factor